MRENFYITKILGQGVYSEYSFTINLTYITERKFTLNLNCVKKSRLIESITEGKKETI